MSFIINQITADLLKRLFAENGFGEISDEKINQILKLYKSNQIDRAKLHKAARDNNRVKSETKKARDRRTHQLCNVGGAVAKYHPEILELYPRELEQLFGMIFNGCGDSVSAAVEDFTTNRRFLKSEGDE